MNHHNKLRLKAWLKKRISFRLHMSIVMFSMIFLGIGSNFLLLRFAGVTHPALRYPITIALSYLWFLIFLRIYLKNIFDGNKSEGSVLDFVDIPFSGSSNSSSAPLPQNWEGGGGQFSGGGASGEWSGPVSSTVSKSSSISGPSVLDAVDIDEGAIVVLVIGAITIAVVFGTGAYFIWHSPEILSECLLQLLLASGLRRKMKKFSDTEWLKHIFKSTVAPVIIILLLGTILGAVMRSKCPTANTFRQFRQTCMELDNEFRH